MKVCIVSLNIVPYFHSSSDRQFGGAEVQAAVLARAFSSAGAEVSLVVSDLPEGVELPVPSHNAFYTDHGVPGFRFLHPRMTGILDALERADADVYFQHCAGMVTGVTSWFCRRRGKKFVYFAGSDSDFSFRDVIIENLRDKLLYFWGVKNAAGIVAQNEYQAELCRSRFKREPRVIPTAVETAEVGEGGGDGSIVWVGALRAVKRPELFLELARRMPERRFILIGGGLSTEPGFSRRITEEAGTIPNVTATGRVPQEDVASYLERASLLVNTSSFEGFPNAFLEAWTRGTPALSMVDVDGLIVLHGVGAVCRDLDQMAEAAAGFLDDENERRAAGKRARRLIETRYAAAVTAREHMVYFGELL
jgi:glycosyltransferase involved in cell wall biosynthesis